MIWFVVGKPIAESDNPTHFFLFFVWAKDSGSESLTSLPLFFCVPMRDALCLVCAGGEQRAR